MQTIKVLIVDDSVVVRRVLTEVLSADPQITVVGTAANGKIALAKAAQLRPDLITLDIEMPEMDGLQTLTALRDQGCKTPVIMCSTLTERGAAITIEALSLGANDYIAKPTGLNGTEQAVEYLRDQLVPKIKAACTHIIHVDPATLACSAPKTAVVGEPPKLPSQAVHVRPGRTDIVVIGVSTGGPNALNELLPRLPRDLPVPVVIVQHMPPMFTKHLADRLNSRSNLAVAEAVAGQVIGPGQVWIAPGDFHLEMCRSAQGVRLVLQQGPLENSCRPAADVLFRSVATTYGPHALAIVLTGMGQDGLLGCKWIRNQGGRVWAQDQASSVVWGMPGAVARAGLAEKILSLDQIPQEITHQVWNGRSRSLGTSTVNKPISNIAFSTR